MGGLILARFIIGAPCRNPRLRRANYYLKMRTITIHWGMLRNAQFGPDGAFLSPCNSGAPFLILIPGLTKLPSSSSFPGILITFHIPAIHSYSTSSTPDSYQDQGKGNPVERSLRRPKKPQ